jgi:hypothetical protein
MRSGHIAWIGAAVTFIGVVALSTWSTGEPENTSASLQTPESAQPVEQISRPAMSPEASAAAAFVEHGPTDPVQPLFDPPGDARAMMDAALTSPDPEVRDEATALSRAMSEESSPPAE